MVNRESGQRRVLRDRVQQVGVELVHAKTETNWLLLVVFSGDSMIQGKLERKESVHRVSCRDSASPLPCD